MTIKNIIRKTIAVSLFIISFFFFIAVIAIIAVPDTDGTKAVMIIVLSLFCIIPLLLGIKLIKTKGKIKSTLKQNESPITQKTSDVSVTVEREELDEIPIEDVAMEEVLKSKKDNFSEILIFYGDASGKISARRISNVLAQTKDGVKYITAYCHMRNSLRTFRFDRVEKLFLNGTESNKNEFYDMLIKGYV